MSGARSRRGDAHCILLALLLASNGLGAAEDADQDLFDRVGLDAADASQFWPVYSEYRYETAKLRAERRRLLDDATNHSATLDAAQANEFIRGWLDNRRDEVKLTGRYVKRFRRVLSDEQVARLMIELARDESSGQSALQTSEQEETP